MSHIMESENNARRADGRSDLLTEPPKPYEYFDLIGGTSTGGIIALMLGRLKMSVEDAINCYDDLAESVFSKMKRVGQGNFKATNLQKAIKRAIKDSGNEEEALLLQPATDGDICKIFVVARNSRHLNDNIAVLFRNYESVDNIHPKCKIWEATRATSAAPTFFKPMSIERDQTYLDGGMGRNNPALVVLEEARNLWPGRRVQYLVSIGTGQGKVIGLEQNPGFFHRKLPMDVINALKGMVTDCGATHEDVLKESKRDSWDEAYHRLNVDQGLQLVPFEKWEKLPDVEAQTNAYLAKAEVKAAVERLANAMYTA